MILLVSGATRDVALFKECGILLAPSSWNSVKSIADSGRKWAADNDAFTNWSEPRFVDMIDDIKCVDRSRLLWIACPDIVGDARGTLRRWNEWTARLLGLPKAFVGQDGLEDIADQIPWDEMSCFFIGGSTKWKLSRAAEEIATLAKQKGKWVHMGRVNSKKRIRHAIEIGADSIDGSGFSKWPKLIPDGLRWVAHHKARPSMF